MANRCKRYQQPAHGRHARGSFRHGRTVGSHCRTLHCGAAGRSAALRQPVARCSAGWICPVHDGVGHGFTPAHHRGFSGCAVAESRRLDAGREEFLRCSVARCGRLDDFATHSGHRADVVLVGAIDHVRDLSSRRRPFASAGKRLSQAMERDWGHCPVAGRRTSGWRTFRRA